MENAPRTWKRVFVRMKAETDPNQRFALCYESRKVMQARLIALSANGGSSTDNAEQRAIEEALRSLWTIEQTLRKSLP